MPTSWDITMERKLLLAIMEAIGPTVPSWNIVSEKMGEGFTAEACRQHYQKIKRDARNGPGSNPPTPTKPKGPKPAASTPKKRKGANVDDDGRPDSTPSKKKAKAEPVPQEEQTAIAFKVDKDDKGKGVDLEGGEDSIYD